MAKDVIERCDKIVGKQEGSDVFVKVAGYKSGDETRYHFGVYLTMPKKFKGNDPDVDKACALWFKRMVSADNAGLPGKIKEGEMTAEEAVKEIMAYNGEDFLVRLNEVKERAKSEPKATSPESLAIKKVEAALRDNHKLGKLETTKVAIPRLTDPPKTEKGNINFNAWAKILQAEKHPWFDKALKLVTQSLD